MENYIQVRELLKKHEIKVTPQRVAVYEALCKLGHASVEQVVSEVSKFSPNVTTATVYNVLDCFAENGVVTRLHTPKGKMYYDISTNDHSHIIDSDGMIFDHDNGELNELIHHYLANNPINDLDIEKVSIQLILKRHAN